MIAPATALKFGLRLRPVASSDAAFLIAQRRHPRATPFLGDTSADEAPQIRWIVSQRERPLDAYWVCENASGVALGAIGIYNVQEKCAEWGRFVIRPGSKAAPGCLLLALTEAFHTMHLQDVVCTTVASNTQAIQFYERAGLRKDDDYSGQVFLRGKFVKKVAHHVIAGHWPMVRQNLQAAAEMKKYEVGLEK